MWMELANGDLIPSSRISKIFAPAPDGASVYAMTVDDVRVELKRFPDSSFRGKRIGNSLSNLVIVRTDFTENRELVWEVPIVEWIEDHSALDDTIELLPVGLGTWSIEMSLTAVVLDRVSGYCYDMDGNYWTSLDNYLFDERGRIRRAG